jgi:hypothetical protein
VGVKVGAAPDGARRHVPTLARRTALLRQTRASGRLLRNSTAPAASRGAPWTSRRHASAPGSSRRGRARQRAARRGRWRAPKLAPGTSRSLSPAPISRARRQPLAPLLPRPPAGEREGNAPGLRLRAGVDPSTDGAHAGLPAQPSLPGILPDYWRHHDVSALQLKCAGGRAGGRHTATGLWLLLCCCCPCCLCCSCCPCCAYARVLPQKAAASAQMARTRTCTHSHSHTGSPCWGARRPPPPPAPPGKTSDRQVHGRRKGRPLPAVPCGPQGGGDGGRPGSSRRSFLKVRAQALCGAARVR